MTDQPTSLSQDALGMLDSAGQLVARAVRMALRAFPEDGTGRFTDDQTLNRAAQLATIAAASARVAHGLIAAEHVDLLREFEARADARTRALEALVAEDGPSIPSKEVWAELDAEPGRAPYEPPTLTGPHQAPKTDYEPPPWTDRHDAD